MTVSGKSELEQKLRSVEAIKEGSYDKRTEHLGDDGKALFINRLILEDSPYLLQHAHNPVNWFPWGAEAFEVARAENKPVFLSIGYSTCHWCHVMEVESFDNVDVAKVLNKQFISIKMDREQYPDIDEIYMTAVQIISGHGGWPMSNFLLPDGKPFFAATYFPAENFLHLLDQITNAWNERFDELHKSAESVHQGVQRILSNKSEAQTGSVSELQLVEALVSREDEHWGGLAGAPKFPQEPILLYLLDFASRHDNEAAHAFVVRALEGMGKGGIHDHVGGGFHRYSVDEEWLVPHFEKMLYNQSQLGLVYLRGWLLSRNPFFARICRRLLDYVLRDMEVPEGGFYSATDADSEGEEGTFFVWTPEQIEFALTEDQAEIILDVFDITTFGNFEGANILRLEQGLEFWQGKYGDELLPVLDNALESLYQNREKRPHPIRDDKRIVAWCAAMASTLIHAHLVFGETRWYESAKKALDHLLKMNLGGGNELTRIYLNGEVSIPAQLEDHVNLIQALILLFDASGERRYLTQAFKLMDAVIDNFWDEESESFFLGPAQQDGPVLVRSRSAGDGAELSAIATALECLWSLEQRARLASTAVDVDRYRELRQSAIIALRPVVDDSPLNHTSLLRVMAMVEHGSLAPVQYGNEGLVRIHAEVDEDSLLCSISCSLVSGWHLTAPDANTEEFSPLSVEIQNTDEWQVETIDYPSSGEMLASAIGEVSIYSGDITVTLKLCRNQEYSSGIKIAVNYQLCNDKQCLLPAQLKFQL